MTEIRIDEQPEYIKIFMEDEGIKNRIQVIYELGTSSYWTDDKNESLEDIRVDLIDNIEEYIDRRFSPEWHIRIVDSFFKNKNIYDISKFLYDNAKLQEYYQSIEQDETSGSWNKEEYVMVEIFKIIYDKHIKTFIKGIFRK
jgi:hypothetical protein